MTNDANNSKSLENIERLLEDIRDKDKGSLAKYSSASATWMLSNIWGAATYTTKTLFAGAVITTAIVAADYINDPDKNIEDMPNDATKWLDSHRNIEEKSPILPNNLYVPETTPIMTEEKEDLSL